MKTFLSTVSFIRCSRGSGCALADGRLKRLQVVLNYSCFIMIARMISAKLHVFKHVRAYVFPVLALFQTESKL